MAKIVAYGTESPFRTSHERGKRSNYEMTSTYIAREGNEVKAKECVVALKLRKASNGKRVAFIGNALGIVAKCFSILLDGRGGKRYNIDNEFPSSLISLLWRRNACTAKSAGSVKL